MTTNGTPVEKPEKPPEFKVGIGWEIRALEYLCKMAYEAVYILRKIEYKR